MTFQTEHHVHSKQEVIFFLLKNIYIYLMIILCVGEGVYVRFDANMEVKRQLSGVISLFSQVGSRDWSLVIMLGGSNHCYLLNHLTSFLLKILYLFFSFVESQSWTELKNDESKRACRLPKLRRMHSVWHLDAWRLCKSAAWTCYQCEAVPPSLASWECQQWVLSFANVFCNIPWSRDFFVRLFVFHVALPVFIPNRPHTSGISTM